MLLYQNKLDEALARGDFAPVYILCSDEPFWHEEYTERIIALAENRNEGYTRTNKVGFDDDSINLATLEEACSSTGLFADKVIIVLSLKSIKSGTPALNSLASCLNPDMLAIVRLPRISKGDLKNKALAPLDNVGITTVFYPMDERNTVRFIQNRAAQMQIGLDPEGASLIYEAYEGNLGAQIQALNKLDLAGLSHQGLLPVAVVRDQVAADRHYTAFEFKDALLDPDVRPQKRLKMLYTLCAEGERLAVLIRNAGNAINDLLEMRTRLDRGIMLDSWFNENPVLRALKSKQQLYLRAANSISTAGVLRLCDLICRADLEARYYHEDTAIMILEEICVLRSRQDFCLTSSDFEIPDPKFG